MKCKESLKNCQLCFPDEQLSPQFGIIFKNLINRLEKQKKKTLQQKMQVIGNDNSFYQLMKCILQNTTVCHNIQWECNHSVLAQYVREVLKIDISDLENLSESLFLTITKRRYELQVIKNLTKNMPKTILKKRFDSIKNQSEEVADNVKRFKQKELQQKNLGKSQRQKNDKSKQIQQTQIQKFEFERQQSSLINQATLSYQTMMLEGQYIQVLDPRLLGQANLNFPYILPQYNYPQYNKQAFGWTGFYHNN